MSESKSRFPLVIAGAAVVAVAVVGSILWAKSRAHDAALKEAAGRPDKIVLAAEEGKITEAERDKAIQSSVQTHLAQQVDGYFALPEGKARNDYLDKLIDAQEKMRVKIEGVKGEPEFTQAPEGVTTKVTESPDGSRKEMKVFVKQKGDASSLPPELRAKVAEFAAAMAKRRAERGLPASPGGGAGIIVVKTQEETR